MADQEQFSPEWGTTVAKWTFIFTALGAAAFITAVFVFIMTRA
jgi:hypothetical protein